MPKGGLRLIDTPEFPDAFKPDVGDWFFVSPAQEFGSYVPGEPRGAYRVGGDVLLRDEAGRSHISGADYALAFVDEIDQPKHHRTRFTVAY